jgi:predicted ester cyclase
VTPTPDSLTRQWFQEVWNDGDERAIDRLLSPDAVVHGLGGSDESPMRGPDAFKPVFRTFRAAIEDLRITVERTYECGDTCVAWCRVRGTHSGSAFGGAPSGREVDFQGVTIIRARDGLLVEGWNVFDFLKMYQQIGWIANPVLPV